MSPAEKANFIQRVRAKARKNNMGLLPPLPPEERPDPEEFTPEDERWFRKPLDG